MNGRDRVEKEDGADASRWRGHCLCGAVTWEAAGKAVWQAHCHCESCRRATGSGIATFVAVPRDGFAWTGAEPAAYASSPGVTRRFCGTCGSPLSYESAEYPGEVHLYAASLDDPARAQPEKHAFWEEHVPWIAGGDGLPR
ncbi:hypothetical protein LX81_01454 [Palleronia aestuarii]|uniref:CENP-V/GFA domain-containing protein n=1 Tax=Palleronia aestuarii TaxID=568105 RepID=A0A2W7NHM5_9RHOB|nr:GFA family protein [Palleronia aestuarii]PZX17727.1 hypothetical protein LX81_01454 [Palleronia aestuarii]